MEAFGIFSYLTLLILLFTTKYRRQRLQWRSTEKRNGKTSICYREAVGAMIWRVLTYSRRLLFIQACSLFKSHRNRVEYDAEEAIYPLRRLWQNCDHLKILRSRQTHHQLLWHYMLLKLKENVIVLFLD